MYPEESKPRQQIQTTIPISKSISADDIRQLAGYNRLKSVYNKMNVPTAQIIKGLIIYSGNHCEDEL